MSLLQANVVDFIVYDDDADECLLVVTDPFPWREADAAADPDAAVATGEHIMLLQCKIGRYLDFVESGELVGDHPRAAGRHLAIVVAGKYRTSPAADDFYRFARTEIVGTLAELRVEFAGDGAEPRAN